MAQKLSAAVIGLGQAGSRFDEEDRRDIWSHVGAYLHLPDSFDLVACSDQSELSREAFRKRCPQIPCYSDHKDLFRNHSIDVVSIATPPDVRSSIVGDIVYHDDLKVIVLEKPMASSQRDREEIVKLIKDFNKSSIVHYNRRFADIYQIMKEKLLSGLIGDITSITIRYSNRLLSIGSHALDLLCFLCGSEFKSYTIHSVPALYQDSEPAVDFLANLKNGAVARLLNHGKKHLGLFEVDIIGSNGRLVASQNGSLLTYFKFLHSKEYAGYLEESEAQVLVKRSSQESTFTKIIMEAAEVALKRRSPSLSALEAANSEKILDTLGESMDRTSSDSKCPLLPAILGGEPIRQTFHKITPHINHCEEEAVLKTLRKSSLSQYIGSDSKGLEAQLALSSRSAKEIKAEWHFLGGQEVRNFSAEFADKLGAEFAIPTNSGTTAITTVLGAFGLEPGDEVIVPAISFSATATAVLNYNLIPVFVDVDKDNFCLCPKEMEKKVGPKTKAVIAVHLLGNTPDMDAVMQVADKHGLLVLEDCAQAPGVKWRDKCVGTIGHAGVFSLTQSKNITTGEGGMILTNDADIARKSRLISNHGEVVMKDRHSDEELANIIGTNYRLTEIAATIGREQLKKLDKINEIRNKNASYLIEKMKSKKALHPPMIDTRTSWVCHVLAFKFDEVEAGLPRDIFISALEKEGIYCGTGYLSTLYDKPIFLRKIAFGSNGDPWTSANSTVEYKKGMCPVAERLLDKEFLWFYQIAYPNSTKEMDEIFDGIDKVLANAKQIWANAEKCGTMKRQGRL
ncbi:MAG: aminotransferase class I/II-fold pyridoxal phosphate-dependent enzyme [Oligoflexales bacterium]